MMSYKERENLAVGQKVYLFYPGFGRNHKGTYSKPLEVIKVTKTQFTVEGEGDSKPKRFMLSNGNEVGRGYSSRTYVSLVTEKTRKEVKAHNRSIKTEKSKKETKERQEEIKLRKKYCANKIVDDAIQKRFLKPLRHQAEIGEGMMQDFLDAFDGVSIEDENFYRVTDTVRREHETGKFEYGLQIRDKAVGLHEMLVNIITHFQYGTRYRIGKTECNDLTELLEARIKQTLGSKIDEFFSYTFTPNRDMSEADQMFITVLREIMDDENSYERVIVIDPEEEAA